MTKHLKGILITASLGIGLCVGVANAGPIIVNGDFETDVWAPGQTNQVSPFGWTTVQSSDSRFVQGVHNNGSTTADFTPFGNQFIILCAVDCSSGTMGSVSQAVGGFTAGQMYQLNFEQSPEVDASAGNFDALVAVTIAGIGSSTNVFSAISAGVPGHNWADWQAQTLTFTADSSTETFTFAGTTNAAGKTDIESGIDNIGLTSLSTPEPASVILFALGLGGLFGLGWSRRKKV